MKIKLLTPSAIAPNRAKEGDAGLDLYAAESIYLYAGHTTLIRTGIAIELDPGTVGYVCSRSGMALKHSVFVLNAPGVVDSSFRGEVGVILHNAGSYEYHVRAGDRVAQLVVQSILHPVLEIVEVLTETDRGTGGFGHTGTN